MSEAVEVQARPRRLARSERERVIAGVCGGIGEYRLLEPVLVRLVYIYLTLVTGLIPGLLLYLILALFLPRSEGPGR